MKTTLLSVDKIIVPAFAKRAENKVSDSLLRSSIEQTREAQMSARKGKPSDEDTGIMIPLILVRDGARLLLAKGLRRLREARALGLRRVPVVIHAAPAGVSPEKYASDLRFHLGHHRQDLLPSQRGDLVWTLKARFAMNNTQVASYLGVAPDTLTNWLAIRQYIPPVVKAMDAGLLSMNIARVFDGMTEAGQREVWDRFGAAMITPTGQSLSADGWHKQVRTTFAPSNHPAHYRQPELVASRLARKSGKRKSKPRSVVSPAEKRQLVSSLEMKETELQHNREEMKRYEEEINAAIAPIAAIMRNPDLLDMVPAEMREEFDRFAEVYI